MGGIVLKFEMRNLEKCTDDGCQFVGFWKWINSPLDTEVTLRIESKIKGVRGIGRKKKSQKAEIEK